MTEEERAVIQAARALRFWEPGKDKMHQTLLYELHCAVDDLNAAEKAVSDRVRNDFSGFPL